MSTTETKQDSGEKPVIYREAAHDFGYRWYEKNGKVWVFRRGQQRCRSTYSRRNFHRNIKRGILIPVKDQQP